LKDNKKKEFLNEISKSGSSNDNINFKYNLLESEIGLYNAGGSCYMASIIQILIHLEKFLKIFLRKKPNNKSTLSYIFYNFINEIVSSSSPIEIKEFSYKYHKINPKFSGRYGNNPMTFFTEFITQLNKENNNNDILNLFKGQKEIIFEGMDELNYNEDFLFYLVSLNTKKTSLYDFIYGAIDDIKELEGDDQLKFKEKIIVEPEILIFNVEINNIEYNFKEILYINKTQYNLKAINRYTDFHSTA
jgi:uncharacterized UBP type Zn finger protein